MKIAVLSDIHGNFTALVEVLKFAKKQNVKSLFLLGDQLGYYYEAQEVYNAILKWPNQMISGNHEKLFLEYLNADDFRRKQIDKKYGKSFRYYKNKLSERIVKHILSLSDDLKVRIDGLTFLLCHGSVNDNNEYLYPDAEIQNLNKMDISGVDFVFNGHTHYPMIYRGKFSTIINVGSVGQSRIIGGIANWGIIDTVNNVYTPQNTPYDVSKVLNNLKLHKEKNKYLNEILIRNNNEV